MPGVQGLLYLPEFPLARDCWLLSIASPLCLWISLSLWNSHLVDQGSNDGSNTTYVPHITPDLPAIGEEASTLSQSHPL